MIYTISPHTSFLDSLAGGLMQRYENLSHLLILLPNRRSCRSLKVALLRSSDKPLLLPDIKAIGDIGESFSVPPAISDLKRKLLLTELIREWKPTLNIEQAAYLAIDLAVFLDELLREGIHFDSISDLTPEDPSLHWQETLEFFKTLSKQYPDALKKTGYIDAMERRNIMIKKQITEWEENPPEYPVIAAGSTGSIPSTASLLKAIFNLPMGHVILPAFDKQHGDVEENHPQFGLSGLLKNFEVKPSDVREWEGNTSSHIVDLRKQIFEDLSAFQLGANNYKLTPTTYITARNLQEEASIIALMMREVLETKEKTVALITHSRNLAKRVSAILKRWEIAVDDSSGVSISETPIMIFLKLIVEMVSSQFLPVKMLSVLKHPFSAGGISHGEFKYNVRRFEKEVLRGTRTTNGLVGLRDKLQASDESLIPWFDKFINSVEKFRSVMEKPSVDLGEILRKHIEFAEDLASTDQLSGREILWQRDDGKQAFSLISEVLDVTSYYFYDPKEHYAEFFDTLWAGNKYRSSFGGHPRVHVLTPMEARLHHYDLAILGGLNAGTWPEDTSGSFVNDSIREVFGLPSSARKTGLSAHDFYTCSFAPEVVFSRSVKVDGNATTPSPWLLRLDSVLKKTGLSLNTGASWKKMAELLNKPDSIITLEEPTPTPPANDRPKKLSVTNIEKLMRDPYSIYASHILHIYPLRKLDEELGAADFGNIIHTILENYVSKRNSSEELLLQCGKEVFSEFSNNPAVYILWWERFVQIAKWFVEKENNRKYYNVLTEIKGKISIPFDGGKFILTAKADRIELTENNTVNIVDYKTGTLPKIVDVKNGFSPQLALEGVIFEKSGFGNALKHKIGELSYWKLSGGNSVNQERKLSGHDILITEAQNGTIEILNTFYDPKTPYLSCPNPAVTNEYNDYAHLSRIKEWFH